MCLVDWKEIGQYELPSLGRTTDSDVYCQQLKGSLKKAIEKSRTELMNRKMLSFGTVRTTDHIHLTLAGKDSENLDGKLHCICIIVRILHYKIIICLQNLIMLT